MTGLSVQFENDQNHPAGQYPGHNSQEKNLETFPVSMADKIKK